MINRINYYYNEFFPKKKYDLPKSLKFDKPVVILVNGLFVSNNSLMILKEKLEEKGHKVILSSPERVWNNFSTNLEQLRRLIQEIKAPSISIVGFSLGGIIIFEALKSDLQDKVDKIITISTPYSGSYWAYFLPWFWEIKPYLLPKRSIMIPNKILPKLFSIKGNFDEVVIPNSSMSINSVQTIKVNVNGHINTLYSEKTIEILDDLLK